MNGFIERKTGNRNILTAVFQFIHLQPIGSVFVPLRFIYWFLQYFYRQSSLHREISLCYWRESSRTQLNHLDPDERIRHRAVNGQMKFLPRQYFNLFTRRVEVPLHCNHVRIVDRVVRGVFFSVGLKLYDYSIFRCTWYVYSDVILVYDSLLTDQQLVVVCGTVVTC